MDLTDRLPSGLITPEEAKVLFESPSVRWVDLIGLNQREFPAIVVVSDDSIHGYFYSSTEEEWDSVIESEEVERVIKRLYREIEADPEYGPSEVVGRE